MNNAAQAQTQEPNAIVWITNTQPRAFHLPDRTKRVKAKVAVQGGAPQEDIAVISLNDGKMIPPSAPRDKDGVQQPTAVDAAYWDLVKNNPQVRIWLQKGWLRINDRNDVGTKEPDTLTKFNTATAKALIEGETNMRLLNDWAQSESRPDVKGAITARVNALGAKKSNGGSGNLPPLK